MNMEEKSLSLALPSWLRTPSCLKIQLSLRNHIMFEEGRKVVKLKVSQIYHSILASICFCLKSGNISSAKSPPLILTIWPSVASLT